MEDSGSSFSPSTLLSRENNVDEVLFSVLNNNYNLSETEDEYIEMLIERETKSSRFSSDCSILIENWLKFARLDAIKWIFKARAFFGFCFQTAYLSVIYFDGFLSKRAIEKGKFWAIRLLSVACLSLAAKMEECRVPALSDYQLEEYNFESKVIQRMELLILNTLEWRMGSITPFSYLHYFITKFCNESRPKDVVSRAAELILAITKEMNLMDHRPSVIAAASVLVASDRGLTRKTMEIKMSVISSCGSLENEHIFSCYNLMQELEMREFKIPKSVIFQDLTSIYSTTVDVLEDYSFIYAASTNRRKLTFKDCDQNCGISNEK